MVPRLAKASASRSYIINFSQCFLNQNTDILSILSKDWGCCDYLHHFPLLSSLKVISQLSNTSLKNTNTTDSCLVALRVSCCYGEGRAVFSVYMFVRGYLCPRVRTFHLFTTFLNEGIIIMGIEPPFLYDAISKNINFPYKEFDPNAVSRASLTPKPPRPKYAGPLIDARTSFISLNSSPTSNSSQSRKSHPLIAASQIEKQLNSLDSLAPHENTDAKFMRPSTKVVVTRMRTVQLILRCFELLGALGLLGISIFLTGIPSKIGLIIRIPVSMIIYYLYFESRPGMCLLS